MNLVLIILILLLLLGGAGFACVPLTEQLWDCYVCTTREQNQELRRNLRRNAGANSLYAADSVDAFPARRIPREPA
jgi:hypothetical protein